MIRPTQGDRSFLHALVTTCGNGLPPTERELSNALGISLTRVHQRLRRLSRFEWITRGFCTARTLVVTEFGWNIVDQLEGRATAGQFFAEQRCCTCGSAHFLGFGARCPACSRGYFNRKVMFS